MACSIIEIFREPNIKIKGVDFMFHIDIWNKLLEIGQQEGWKPMGTEKPQGYNFEYFKNDYNPDYPESKVVSLTDANNLAMGLSKALKKYKAKKVKELPAKQGNEFPVISIIFLEEFTLALRYKSNIVN